MEMTTSKDSDTLNTNEVRTLQVDRDGSVLCKNAMYLLFMAIEEVRKSLKQFFTQSGHKSAIIKRIVEGEKVQFYC